MKPSLEDTLLLVVQKHCGQTDKAGAPYVFHPIRVMENLGASATEPQKMAALLHDVVEDCGVSLDDLRRLGYAEEVVEAVDHLTKNEEGERDYQLAIERAAGNPIARKVKIADLTDNMRRDRITHPTTKDEERLAKYAKAKAWLESL